MQLVFHNQDQKMENIEDSHLITPTSASSTSWLQSRALAIPVEEQAPCFFISNFVRMPRNLSTRGSFDFLLPIIKTERTDSAVSVAFRAVAMAALANRPNSKSSGLMIRAIAQYSKALKGLNLALQNPQQQKTDATLATILLMVFFEVSGFWEVDGRLVEKGAELICDRRLHRRSRMLWHGVRILMERCNLRN